MRTTAAFLALAAVAVGAVAQETPADTGDAQPSQPAARQRGNDFAMPPEMVAKLSPEQIVSVLRAREEARGPNIPLALALFSTLGGMVLVAQVYATRRERIRHEVVRAMVDKGMEIPPDLVVKRSDQLSDLRRGLVLVGAGLGLSGVFGVVHLSGRGGSGLWSIGIIPILMGAGYLVVWRIATRNAPGR